MNENSFKLADHYDDPAAMILFGGGGHGKTVIDAIQASGNFHLVGVIDDHITPGSYVMNVPVLGGSDLLPELFERGLRLATNGVGGIGNPEFRDQVFLRLQTAGFHLPVVTHPTAYIAPTAKLEDGAQIMARTVIGAEAHIGYGTLVNIGAIVTHECHLGRVVNLSPGAAMGGRLILEEYVQVGMNATINLGVHVARKARIGNGATVKADVPADTTVYAGTIWPVRKPANS